MTGSAANERIGVFGGTFDPIHNGHTAVAEEVCSRFALDRLLLIPAHRAPHKRNVAMSDDYHRFAMAVMATLDIQGILVSTVELEEPEKPYSYQTMERLHQVYPNRAIFFFIMGADSFSELNTWREPRRLLASTNVIVAARPGHRIETSHLPLEANTTVIDLRNGLQSPPSPVPEGSTVFLTDFVRNDISATRIRARVAEGKSIAGLVHERVADYILKYQLYRH